MLSRPVGLAILTTAVGTLAACGGSTPVNSTPTPIVTPPPEVPPSEPTQAPAGPIGLVSSEPFEVLGVSVDFTKDENENWSAGEPEKADIALEYRASDDAYTITLPGFRPGVLMTDSVSGSYDDNSQWSSIYGTYNDLLDGESGRQDAEVFLHWASAPLNTSLDLTYTSWGSWGDDYDVDGTPDTVTNGYFAYGIPTATADVPRTGSATYNATVIGMTNQTYEGGLYSDYISGTAQLLFNFGAGTLKGEMQPSICPWDCFPLGVYSFIQTLYATGSSSFSGQFAINGNAVPSWFEGSFNGPNAAELMARWQAPYTTPESYPSDHISGTMTGIWIGKKE